ncbi:MAG TPA: hypothetical protein VKA01_17645 [Vicinamibacteria bacterium]|nr:hypothetical protein [Vicinamibacteria bacterium]
MPCAAFYNDYTFGDCFPGAALVAGSFEPFRLDTLLALCSRPRAAFPLQEATG